MSRSRQNLHKDLVQLTLHLGILSSYNDLYYLSCNVSLKHLKFEIRSHHHWFCWVQVKSRYCIETFSSLPKETTRKIKRIYGYILNIKNHEEYNRIRKSIYCQSSNVYSNIIKAKIQYCHCQNIWRAKYKTKIPFYPSPLITCKLRRLEINGEMK